MSTQDAGARQDLVENGVDRELLSIQEDLTAPQDIGSSLQAEVEHDLIVWPREYLETYLNTGSNGTIPLNEVQLQDVLEAAFDRDEELARNALTTLKNSMNNGTAATLTVSMDDESWDRTAYPVLVSGITAGDAKECQYLLRIENDGAWERLRELLEKTAAVVQRRALLEALNKPGATFSYSPQWSTASRTSDRSVFVDIDSQPSVAIEPDRVLSRPGVFDSLKAWLHRLLHTGRREDENPEQQLPRVNPEFLKENSRYVAQYEPDGATVRVHDKRWVKDERAVASLLDRSSAEREEKISIATEKTFEEKGDKDQTSLTTALSQLSDSMQVAAGRADLLENRRRPALTDSGVYTGKIISETSEFLIQRISSASEVAHSKSLFAQIPQIGELVRIAYQSGVATVRQIQERKLEKEISR